MSVLIKKPAITMIVTISSSFHEGLPFPFHNHPENNINNGRTTTAPGRAACDNEKSKVEKRKKGILAFGFCLNFRSVIRRSVKEDVARTTPIFSDMVIPINLRMNRNRMMKYSTAADELRAFFTSSIEKKHAAAVRNTVIASVICRFPPVIHRVNARNPPYSGRRPAMPDRNPFSTSETDPV